MTSAINSPFVVSDGTTEYTECSGRGICDYSSGTCSCFDNFLSSDGVGGPGSRGDCGHFYWDIESFPTNLFCPYAINWETNTSELCSGHGSCSSGACNCDEGYGDAIVFSLQTTTFLTSSICVGGPGCSEKLCTSVNAWFGSVGQTHGGVIECAGVGDCDRQDGICRYMLVTLRLHPNFTLKFVGIAVETGALSMGITASICPAQKVTMGRFAGTSVCYAAFSLNKWIRCLLVEMACVYLCGRRPCYHMTTRKL